MQGKRRAEYLNVLENCDFLIALASELLQGTATVVTGVLKACKELLNVLQGLLPLTLALVQKPLRALRVTLRVVLKADFENDL